MMHEILKHIARYLWNPAEVWRNISLWRHAKISEMRIVFVLGAPRSGTTLIHRVLLNHRRIYGFAAETSVFSPKSLFEDSRFDALVGAVEWRDYLRQSRDVVSLFETLHLRAFPQGSDAGNWYVEKTPQHVKRLAFLLRHFPEAKFVHLVRDGRDAYCSGRAAGNIPQCSSAASYARYWKTCLDSRLRENSSRILDVRYEDFVANPSNWLSRIMAFIGLECDAEQQLAMTQRARDDRASAPEFARLASTIDSSTVGRWKKELTDVEIETFERRAADILVRFGYVDIRISSARYPDKP